MGNEAASYCPACGAEYREGFTVCADDSTELVPGPKPMMAPEPAVAPEPEPNVDRWSVVARFEAEEEARLLAGRLQSEGISARIYPEWTGDYYGQVTNRIVGRPIEVVVPQDKQQEARAIIAETQAT